ESVAEPKPRFRVDVGDADGRRLGAITVAHEHEGAGYAASDDRVQALGELRRLDVPAAADDEQGEQEPEAHRRPAPQRWTIGSQGDAASAWPRPAARSSSERRVATACPGSASAPRPQSGCGTCSGWSSASAA